MSRTRTSALLLTLVWTILRCGQITAQTATSTADFTLTVTPSSQSIEAGSGTSNGLKVDSQMPGGIAASATPQASPWSWSFTNTSGTVLYAEIQIDNGPVPSDVSVTYNGVAMTALGSVSANNNSKGFIGLFRLLNPATGSNMFSVSWSGGSGTVSGGAISFTGNDPFNPDNGSAITAN